MANLPKTCPPHRHLACDGEIITTCCADCTRDRRRTPCTACQERGGQSGWQGSYLNEAAQAAAETEPDQS